MLHSIFAGLTAVFLAITGIFHAPQPAPVVQTDVVEVATSTNSNASTTDAEMTLCNGQYWKKCPEGQMLVCPTDKTDAYCSTPKTPSTKSSVTHQTPSLPPVDSSAQQKASQAAADLLAQQLAAQKAANNAAAALADKLAAQEAAKQAALKAAQQDAERKQANLNEINEEIAALGAKYLADDKAIQARGGIQSQIDGARAVLYDQYQQDYNALQVKYQQILYGQ